MTVLTICLILLSGLSLLVWITRHGEINRQRKGGFLLGSEFPAPSTGPRLTMLVAAKDEERCIEACVRGLLSQDYQNLELLVVNDRSSDRTAEIVKAIATEDPRVRLINIDHLGEGWCGKNHAMQHGIAASTGQWIFMTDADCRLTSPRTLSIALAYATQQQADLLSILPNLEMKGFWENAVMPVCSGIMMIWFHPDKVNDPDKPQGYANGAFMLIRREAYDKIGTHEAVKDKVNEDMHMAWRLKSQGMKLHVVRNKDLCIVRMYTSLHEIFRGWSRIFYGTFGTVRRVVLSMAVLLVISLLPYLAAIFGFAAAGLGGEPRSLLLCLGLVGSAGALLQLSAIYRFYRMIGARTEMFWTYPIGCGVGLAALFVALGKMRKGAKLAWRNTTYAAGTKA